MSIRKFIDYPIKREIVRPISGDDYQILTHYRSGNVCAYGLIDLGNRRGIVSEAEGDYYNPVVRLRRTDNAERSFHGLEVINGALLAWVNGASAYCVKWYDQSGLNNDMAQSNTARQPLVVNTGVFVTDSRGNLALDFDGTDDRLTASGFAFNYTNFNLVTLVESDAVATGAIFSGLDAFNDGVEILYLATGPRLAVNANDLDVSDTVTDCVLMSANHDGSTLRLAVDGVESTQASTETVSVTSSAEIGIRSTVNPLNGKMAFLLGYSVDNSSIRAQQERDLSRIYNTALT